MKNKKNRSIERAWCFVNQFTSFLPASLLQRELREQTLPDEPRADARSAGTTEDGVAEALTVCKAFSTPLGMEKNHRTKQEMAELLAKRFPDELESLLPTKRKL
jgi:hypothetical protein